VELLGGEKIHIPKRPGEPDCTWADISRIALELGWKPQVSFEEGVAKILANIDYWREAPLWDPASIAEATKTWFEYLSPQGHG
jgi:UDP-glucose 4-epimerase